MSENEPMRAVEEHTMPLIKMKLVPYEHNDNAQENKTGFLRKR